MAFFVRCISGNSLKGMARGDGDDDELGGSGGSTTPNDTAHGGSKFSSYSWKRLSTKSRSSLNSPKKQYTPPLSATSADGTGMPRAAMEPVMERTCSALTDLEAVKFLVDDWSRKHWRPATPQDQERFDRLDQTDIQPLVALGEGAYGSVNLCRIPAKLPIGKTRPQSAGPSTAGATPAVASAGGTQAPLSQAGAARPARSASSFSAAAATGPAGEAEGPTSGLEPTTASGSDCLARPSVSGDASGPASVSGHGSGSAVDVSMATVASAGRDGGLEAAVAAPAAAVDISSAADANVQDSSSVSDPELIVAVKRVPLGWNQERELMQLHRCQQCPFIVRLFGFVDDGTEHCSYVMEWAEGGDLGVMLASLKDRRGMDKQRLLMSEASARYYMGCLLLALEFLHGNGLLHRDIKPSNLLLTSDGTAKLADLGFTVALDANGHTVGCCGTAGYIAPEVYAYGTSKSRMCYGVPADIWSAGATLYQILTGHVVTDRSEEVLKKGWRPPAHPRFSHHLQDLLNRMLAVKPTARPQSATSVMRHPWFSGFDWGALREGRMKAPYVPAERRRRVRETAVAAGGSGGGGGGSATTTGPPTSGAVTCQHALDVLPAAASPSFQQQQQHHHHQQHHQHHGLGGGQRLATVVEGVSTQPTGLLEGDRVVQRSALSGRGEGSVKHGREGLVRDGASFETALGTVTKAEARAAAEGAATAAATAAMGASATVVVAALSPSSSSLSEGGAVAFTSVPSASGSGGSSGLDPTPMPIEPADLAHGHAHMHGQAPGMSVRFALGVAECA